MRDRSGRSSEQPPADPAGGKARRWGQRRATPGPRHDAAVAGPAPCPPATTKPPGV